MDALPLTFVLKLARIKAHQIGPPSEREDVEQDLVLEVLVRFPAFDPIRGNSEAFVEQVVKGKVSKIIRDRQREKRSGQRRPMPERVDRGDFVRDADLRMDLEEVLRDVPVTLHDACDQLRRETVSEAARNIGVPRSTLDSGLIGLRERFRKGSLDKYIS